MALHALAIADLAMQLRVTSHQAHSLPPKRQVRLRLAQINCFFRWRYLPPFNNDLLDGQNELTWGTQACTSQGTRCT